MKLYGRKLKLQIVCNPKNMVAMSEIADPNLSNTLDAIVIEQDDLKDDGLRVVFDIDYPGYQGWYYSEITIYNFNQATLLRVIEEGAAVYLEAGYIDGNFGQIFSGYVFQSLFEREGVTDYKLTLRCIDGAGLFDDNICSTAISKGFTQSTYFNAVCAYSQNEIQKGKISALGTKQFPRDAVIHTTPAEALRETLSYNSSTEASNKQLYAVNGKVEVVDLTDSPESDSQVIEITPDYGGLIGSPVQTDYGADFTCLLNPSITLSNPRKLVKLNMASIKQMRAIHGSGPISILDEDQEFQVIGVRHTGDTRGDEWYTHVTGINKGGKIPIGFEDTEQRTMPAIVKIKGDKYS